MLDPKTTDHFYTTSPQTERLSRYKKIGVEGYILKEPKDGAVKLYRYYFPSWQDHFYSINPSIERIQGGREETSPGWVFPNDTFDNSLIPLYRFWNEKLMDHFYTTNPNNYLLEENGYHKEGIECYVYSKQKKGTVPFQLWVLGESMKKVIISALSTEKKNVFISYANEDMNKVKLVKRRLIATKVLNPVIIADYSVADNRQSLIALTERIRKGISTCDYFLPIITRQSVSTQWINQEIGFISALKRKRKKIFPIVEKELISKNKLKGFINKEVNLPYTFDGNRKNKRSEANKFSNMAAILINDILKSVQ